MMVLGAGVAASAWAGPTGSVVGVGGPDDTSGVAASALSGWTAFADSFEDSVEVRWNDGTLKATITKAQIAALVPWMDLNGSSDGVGAVAFSDSGRLLFIAVSDSNPPTDGRPSDAVLRYDTDTGDLRVFARVEIGATDAGWAHEALAHHAGRLYVGGMARLEVYRARANDATGTLLSSVNTGATVTGLAVDRSAGLLHYSVGAQVFRAPLGDTVTPTLTGTLPAAAVGLAFVEHFGAATDDGLYALDTGAPSPGIHRVWRVPPAQARGQQMFAPTMYVAGVSTAHDVAYAPDGRLILGLDEDAFAVRETSDTRLGFEAWTRDEFTQVVAFGRSLITRGPGAGGPEGWVIDADTEVGRARFHPASPDGAAWTVLLLMMNDHVNGDPSARADVRTVLRRYAGRAADGIVPLRSADGIFWHWLNPATGGDAGWGDGYATMSTMKIALAAARARAFYADDAEIRASADAILCGLTNWDAYFTQSGQMYLLGNAGGGAFAGSASSGFHEGILFTDQAGVYGGSFSGAISNLWMTRSFWPTSALVSGRPVSGAAPGQFQPAFITIYPWLLIDRFRSDAAWRTNMANLRVSHAAWTDDAGPRWNTVFSAGTTAAQWGGYHADSLSDHPGDVSTFPALLALVCGDGTAGRVRVPEAFAAYQAYRSGARQAFSGGASILYRRSSVTPTYTPDSAGLPDVAMGALGLAELILPGSVRAVLTEVGGPYSSCDACPADFNGDGFLDFFDYDEFVAAYETGDPRTDFNADGFLDFFDYDEFVAAYESGC
jgi:hypothetical protein